jgi:uncharacterized membrane protein YdbT with pleckstrin-like domain
LTTRIAFSLTNFEDEIMGYVDTILRPDEQVVYTGKIHRIIYVKPIVNTIVGLIVLGVSAVRINDKIENDDQNILIGVFLLGVLLFSWGIMSFFSAVIYRWTTEIAVTTRRVIIKRGLISRQTMEMNLNKVESVFVTQSVLGRVLNFGDVDVKGTGSSIEDLDCIASPISLRRSIESMDAVAA